MNLLGSVVGVPHRAENHVLDALASAYGRLGPLDGVDDGASQLGLGRASPPKPRDGEEVGREPDPRRIRFHDGREDALWIVEIGPHDCFHPIVLQEGLGGARVRIARRGHDGFAPGGERLDHRPTLPACGTEYEVRLSRHH